MKSGPVRWPASAVCPILCPLFLAMRFPCLVIPASARHQPLPALEAHDGQSASATFQPAGTVLSGLSQASQSSPHCFYRGRRLLARLASPKRGWRTRRCFMQCLTLFPRDGRKNRFSSKPACLARDGWPWQSGTHARKSRTSGRIRQRTLFRKVCLPPSLHLSLRPSLRSRGPGSARAWSACAATGRGCLHGGRGRRPLSCG